MAAKRNEDKSAKWSVAHQYLEVLLKLGWGKAFGKGVGQQIARGRKGGGNPAHGHQLAHVVVGNITMLVGLVLDGVDGHREGALVVIEEGDGLHGRVEVEGEKGLAKGGSFASRFRGATILGVVGCERNVGVQFGFPADNAASGINIDLVSVSDPAATKM